MPIPRRVWLFEVLFLSSWLAGACEAAAQTRTPPCADSAAASPADIDFRLSLGERTVLHEGEIIPLRLSLTSSAKGAYYADTRSYDRSGRLDIESFCLEPPLGRDPLADYFGAQLFGFVGGGLSSGPRELGEEAFTFERELNEWKAVPPGRYRLRVVRPVDRVAAPDAPGRGTAPVAALSNAVEFEVIPATQEWQEAQLADALRSLDSGEPERSRRGARILRFLGSKEATRELVRRYTGEDGQPHAFELHFGIIGSPHRELAISALRSALVDRQHPVTKSFVELLALLEIQSYSEHHLPPYDPQDREGWAVRQQAKAAAYGEIVQRHLATAAGAVERKSPEARARSFDLLLLSLGSDPAGRAQARQQVLAAWDSLQPRQQNALLEYRWAEIGGPELLPLLRRLVDAPVRTSQSPDTVGRELALRRLYELSPAEGRELILREIRDGKGDIGPRLLGILPDRELPDVEDAVLAKLEARRGRAVDYALIERYATARALPRMKSVYGQHRGGWPCDEQSAMLRYFLRVDPPHGIAEVETALSTRERTGCYRGLFSNLHEAVGLPAIERIVTQALDDPSPEVASDAARALARYGSARAEQALWRRLERFHREWKNEAHQFRRPVGRSDEIGRQATLELTLAQSIGLGQSWFCGPEKLKALRELVSPSPRTLVDLWIDESRRDTVTLGLRWGWPEHGLRFSLGSWSGSDLSALKQKLGQMPAGKRLIVNSSEADRETHRAEIEEIEKAARAAGFDVIRP